VSGRWLIELSSDVLDGSKLKIQVYGIHTIGLLSNMNMGESVEDITKLGSDDSKQVMLVM
jgi:hypothetical protein